MFKHFLITCPSGFDDIHQLSHPLENWDQAKKLLKTDDLSHLRFDPIRLPPKLSGYVVEFPVGGVMILSTIQDDLPKNGWASDWAGEEIRGDVIILTRRAFARLEN